MQSSVMLHHVVLVRTDVSKELSASIIRVTRFGELGTTFAVTDSRCEEILHRFLQEPNSILVFLRSMHRLLVMANILSSPILVTLMMEALSSSDTSVLTRATWHNNPENGILQTHRCENLKS
jgi:hypothetical protein